jgi:hypothetical protein
VANIVKEEWFSRYPWPTQVTFDCGSEFIGHEFKKVLNDYGVKKKPITTRNPQANAIVKQVHQTIGNTIQTFELHDNYLDEDDPWKGILAATAFAICATYHTTLQTSPGQLVSGRHMKFNVQHTVNWEYIPARKQCLIQKNNKNKDKKQVPHTYHVNDKVMLCKGVKNKYEVPFSGPHKILKVNSNGTVCLCVGSVNDTINIHRIGPYKESSVPQAPKPVCLPQ